MKTIILKNSGIGRYDDVSPFIIADNALELKVELPNYNGEYYLVAKNNGATFKRTIPHDGNIKLDGLTAGGFNAEVKHYLKGELIKVYKVEPLLLKEVDGTLSAMPEIEQLKGEISALNKELKEAKEEQTKSIKRLEERLLGVLRFALHDFQNNPYLDGYGGMIDEFLERIDITLTEQEIELITGGNQDADNED